LPFSDPATHLLDILEAINHIETFVAEMDLESYKADSKTKSAVERQMQIITEAAVRLGDDAERLVPGPDWKGLRGMGNVCDTRITGSMMSSFGMPYKMNCPCSKKNS
jgi:uncharacterized protein with HEPN domain